MKDHYCKRRNFLNDSINCVAKFGELRNIKYNLNFINIIKDI